MNQGEVLEKVTDMLRDIPDNDTIPWATGTAKADFAVWNAQTDMQVASVASIIPEQPFAGLKINRTNSVINAGGYAL